MRQRLETARTRLSQQVRDLHTLSPLNTLARGYAIVSQEHGGKIVRAASEVEPGDSIKARLAEGSLICEVVSRET
jgi:exodeoxyribonuclease VII large subunit